MEKRAISPVIATILLIAITFILALIVFLWARGFIGEEVQKFGSPIKEACKEVSFSAEAVNEKLNIVNKGNIAIYGLDIKKSARGELLLSTPLDIIIKNGGTASLDLPSDLAEGDTIVVIPEILGQKGEDGPVTPYSCLDFGQELTI